MAKHDDWLRFAALPVAAIAVAGHVQAAQYLTIAQAQDLMFGKSANFERSDLKFNDAARSAIKNASGVKVERAKQPLWEVREGERLVGYFIVDEVYGKHEYITYAVALEADGRVRQIEVLVYRESYGYEIRNSAWRAQFIGKKSGDPVRLDEDIKNISGATMSCRHISEGVRRLLATYDYALRAR
jgi:Na+-translocating ferredoxin:NAD+ oxidoreductase RnfG subunit